MKDADQRTALNAVADKLTRAIRGTVIEPGEVVLATIERIRVQTYDLDVTSHAITQLGELASTVNGKLRDELRAIQRLRDGLDGFEQRLTRMNQARE
jgi:hypothetical protein